MKPIKFKLKGNDNERKKTPGKGVARREQARQRAEIMAYCR